MTYDGITIKQYKNFYELYNQHQILIARLIMPNDGQMIRDSACLQAICHVLGFRYGTLERKKEVNRIIEYKKGGVQYRQIGLSEYVIGLPSGDVVCVLRTPPDRAYIEDGVVCEIISVNIALRYGLVKSNDNKSRHRKNRN